MAEHSIDPKAVAKAIVQLAGGPGNIQEATHCFTRLRLTLANRDAADDEKIKSIPGVQGVFFLGGQYQIALGRDLYPVFAAVSRCCPGQDRTAPDVPPPAQRPDENIQG